MSLFDKIKKTFDKKMEEMPEILAGAKEKAGDTLENLKKTYSDKIEDATEALDRMNEKMEEKGPDTQKSATDAINNSALFKDEEETLDLVPLDDSPADTNDITVYEAKEIPPVNEKPADLGTKDHSTALREGAGDALGATVAAAIKMGDMIQEKADAINKSGMDKLDETDGFFKESEVVEDIEIIAEETVEKKTVEKKPKKDGKKSYSDLMDDAKDALFG